ncbi:MAG: IPT/TIG domain-containing protein, partial [Candidatus Kapabacteria bacterium]|nr:IPT/TIG domain-containing protein [Candidatus Kapabacteria bacterium]
MKPVSPLLFRAALVFLLAAAFALSDVQLTAQTYYYKHNEPEDTNNWGTMPGGNGPHPPNFTNNGLNFIIESGNTVDLDAIWVLGTGGTVPTLTIQSSAVLRIDTDGVFYNNGVTTVQGGGTLELRGSSLPRGIVLGVNAIIYANTTATLKYTRSRTPTWQELPPTMSGSVIFGSGSPDIFTLSAGSVVMGYVTNTPSSTLNTGGHTLQIGFRGINNGIINVNAGGVFAVSNGSRFRNDDALLVQASGTLRLEGTGVIEGDNAVNYVAASNLLYSGSGNRLATQQEFPALMLGNVGMNKTAVSSVSISGARALSAASVLSLTSGTVQTATTGGISVLTIQNPAASAIVGANSTSYIDGPIARALPTNITVDGTTVVFPTGEGTNYRPISLKDIRTNGTATRVRMWSLVSSTVATYSAPLTGISSNRAWQGVQTSGFGLGQTKIDITDAGVVPSSVVASTTASVFGQYKAGAGATSATVVGMTVTMPFVSSLPSAPTALYMAVGAYTAPTTFYYFPNAPNNAASVGCWWSNPGGTGVNPANFTTNGDQFIIETGKLAPLGSAWTFGTGGTVPILTVQPSAVLSIGTNGILYNNGTTTIQAGGRMELSGASPTGIALGINAIVYASTTAILHYSASRTPTRQELSSIMTGSVWFGNGAANTYTLSAGSTVMGYVTNETLSTLNTGGNTLQIGFRGGNKGTLNLNNGGVLAVSNGSRFRNDALLSVQASGTLRLEGTGVVEGNNAVTYLAASNLLYIGSGNRLATQQEFPAFMSGDFGINKTSGSVLEFWGARSLGSASVLGLTSGTIQGSTTGGISVLAVQNPSVTAIIGGNSTSYIDGPLTRALPTNIVADGTMVLYPIGESTSYRPVTLKDIRTNATPTQVQMRALTSSTAATYSAPLTGISSNRAWQGIQTSGFGLGQTSIEITDATANLSSVIASTIASVSGQYKVDGGATLATVVGMTVTMPLTVTLPSAPTALYMAVGSYLQPTTFYYSPNPPNNAGNVLCWWSNSGGTGVNPSNFITNGDQFIIETGIVAPLSSTWTLGTGGTVPILTVQPSAVLSIGTGGVLYNNGTTTIQGSGRVEIGGVAPSGIALGINAIVYASTSAILHYSASRTPTWQELPPTMTGSVWFGNGVANTYTLSAGSVVMGNVTNETFSTLNTGGNTLQIGFRGSNRGTLNLNAGSVLAVSSGSRFRNDALLSVQASGTLRLEGTGVVEGNSAVDYALGSDLLYIGAGNRTATQQEFPALPSVMAGNLGINKTSGSVLELWGARTMSASSALSLTSGILRTATVGGVSVLKLQNSSPLAISGGNTLSFIEGPLVRTLDNGDYLFPIGANGQYLPSVMTDVAATAAEILMQAFNTSTTGTTGLGLQSVSATEHWRVSLLSGVFTGAQPSFYRPGTLSTEILATTTASLAASPLIALPMLLTSTFYGGVSGYALSSNVLPATTLFPLSNTAFFALGVRAEPPVFAGFGTALQLDGIAQYGVIPSGYILGGDFSVEVLVRPASGGVQRRILSKFDCTDGGYDLSLDASNRAVLTIFSSCLAGDSDTLRSLTPLSNGAWTHLAIARNAVTNRYTIYINGISDAVLMSSRSPGASASPFFIGAKGGTSDFFAGGLDEIRLWNTNLSTIDNPTEGALVRYRGIEVNSVHPRWSSLVGYWRCNDIAGVSVSNSVAGAAMNLIGAPALVGGSTSCSVVADVAAPVQWQLLGTKQGGSVTFATIDAMNGGAALGTVSITSSGMMTYTPIPPIPTTNITDNFQYRIADGMGTVSTANVFVHFAPASDVLSSQTVEAGAVAFLPSGEVSARGGIAPFSITYTPENVVLPASGDLTTSFSASTTTSLTLTRLLTDRYGLTDAQPITITTVFTPTTLAFSSVSSAGTDGLPPLREFRSGLTDSVTVGVFTGFGFAAPVPNANLQVTIAPLAGDVAQFQILGNTALLTAQSFRTINTLRIFWLNPPFLGGTTQATLTAHIFGAGSVQSTSLAVTVRASALTPEITSVLPVGGIVGTTITISGVYFGTPLSVRFGSVVASGVTLLSSTQLSVVVPAGAVNAPITVDFVNGTATSPLNFQVVLPPMVDIFEPSIGSTGTTVTINGINFIAPLQVFFGDSAATSFHINSSMEIEAIVGGGMTGKVRVVTLGGTGISDSIFTYWGRPTITGFSPTIVPLGAQVCITGTNFSAEDLLFVGDVPIPVFTFISLTSICFTLDSAISGMVTIVTDVGSANAAEILRYLAPPTITSFSPSVVASNGVVVIRGQNFINVTSVTIGSATFASFHVDSPTQITVRLAGGQQQSTSISVSTPAGTVVSVGQLFIVEPPQIATFAPLLAGRGAFITITGANFTAEPLPRVQFGFAQSDSVIFISSTQISVRVPALAQSGRFILYTPGGAVSSAQTLFVILPPTVTDFDPMRGSTGTTVNIRGTYFYEINAVRFGTATAASFRIESPELIIAQVSRGETGFVSVVGSQGIAKSTEEFEFVRNLALPIITEFTPTSGGRGREVEITGRNFGGAVTVRFGGREAQFMVISDTRISATVGEGTSGQVQVTTPNGTATSLERFQFISDTIKVVAQTPRQQDSSILVRLYATTTGQQWLRQRAWLSDMPISSWAGVTVEHDRVVGLLLPSNNLRGNLPAFLGQLTDIEVLDMSFNELSGEIPAAITSLPKLRILELNNNQLSGAYPSNFGTTATLQILHLQHNVLTGALNNASTVAVYDSVANTIISSTTAIAAICGLRNLRELNVS